MNNQPDYNNQNEPNNQANSFWQDAPDPQMPNEFFGETGAPNGSPAGAGRGSQIFKDKLFLTVCILLSVASLVNFPSFNILTILITIGAWILFAAVQRNKNPFSTCGIKMISGTVKAQFILFWVGIALLLVMAIILFAVAPAIQSAIDPHANSIFDILPEYAAADIDQATQEAINNYLNTFFPGMNIVQIFELLMVILGIAFACIAIGLAVINLVFIRPLRTFLVSFGQNAPLGLPIARANYVRICLMVFAILQIVFSIPSLLSFNTEFIARGCIAVAMFLGSLLIGKYCITQPNQTQTF